MANHFINLNDISLQQILDNSLECSLFKQFLDEERASEHLLFWLEADVFKSIEDPAYLKQRATQIYEKYFHPDSPYQININSSILKTIKDRIALLNAHPVPSPSPASSFIVPSQSSATNSISEYGALPSKSESWKPSSPIKDNNDSSDHSLSSSGGSRSFLGSTPKAQKKLFAASRSMVDLKPNDEQYDQSNNNEKDETQQSEVLESEEPKPSPKTEITKSSSADALRTKIAEYQNNNKPSSLTIPPIDRHLFTKAQSSVFTLMEMDCFPRFLQSELYIKHLTSVKEKEQTNEDLTYLLLRAKHKDKGVILVNRNRNGNTYPDCFVAADFITWLVRNLYLSDRSQAIDKAIKLHEKGYIVCVCAPSHDQIQLNPSDPKKENFQDNDAFWRFTQKLESNNSIYKPLKKPEDILMTSRYRTCDRSSFKKIDDMTVFLLDQLDILSAIVISTWPIPKAERDEFSRALTKITHSRSALIPLIKDIITHILQRKDVPTDLSIINSLMDNFFALAGKDYIQAALLPFFNPSQASHNNPLTVTSLHTDFERDLCFDLKSETDDTAAYQRQFLKNFKIIVESVLSADNLAKLPNEIREVSAYLYSCAQEYVPTKADQLVAGFVIRPIINALQRPDLYDLVEKPYVPLPTTKENIALLCRVLQHLIMQQTFHKNLKFMAFCNLMLEEKFKVLKECIKDICQPCNTVQDSQKLKVVADYKDYASMVIILYDSKDKLETQFTSDRDDPMSMGAILPEPPRVSAFFSLLHDAHSLVAHGNQKDVLQLYYSPIFANCKTVLDFVLVHNIDVKLHKIDFLFGDLKEDPILVHGSVSICGCMPILRYLADKFYVPKHWYPSSLDDSYSDVDCRMQAQIDQHVSWCETNLAAAALEIFRNEVSPHLSNSGREDKKQLDAGYHTLSEALNFLESYLKDGQYLISDKISVADLLVVEQLHMVNLFQLESLDAYKNVHRWYTFLKDEVHYWNEANVDFDHLVQFVTATSSNEGIAVFHHNLCFQMSAEEVFKQMQDAIKHLAGFPTPINTPKFNHPSARGSIAQTLDALPERVIISNYKDDNIPDGHLTILEYKINEIDSTTGSQCKLAFNMINLPPAKYKVIADEWYKIWKQMNGLYVTDLRCTIYVQQPPNIVWDMLLTSSKMSSVSKTLCKINPKIGDNFFLFDGTVNGTNLEVRPFEVIVQRWRMHDWPEQHFSTLKYVFESYKLGNVEGTLVHYTQTEVPQDSLKDLKDKHRQYWKKMKAESVKSFQQTVFFQEQPVEVYGNFHRASSSNSGFKLTNYSELMYDVFKCSDYPSDHLSKVTVNLFAEGDRDVRTRKGTKLILTHENVPSEKVQSTYELWEKYVWKKLNGVVTSNQLKHSIIFNLVSPSDVYENLLNIGKFTQKKCDMTDQVGEDFTLYDGKIQGKNVKLLKNRIIVQKWRFTDWPEHHYSVVRFVLKELTQQTSKNERPAQTTKLFFTQDNIPAKHLGLVLKFWDKFWRKFKNPDGGIYTGSDHNDKKERRPLKKLGRKLQKDKTSLGATDKPFVELNNNRGVQ